ncbi:MAG: mannose-1-phosphate guanylyltransferase [Bacteroidales bacterium]|nr:mannose-1-phosphate guanylyltransferase [Bacteroidales bacterium]
MAGGIGSRFWPLSKTDRPKQFLDILGTGKTFLRATFERFLPLVSADRFVVVTNDAYKGLVLEQLPELQPSQVLCEPMRRNTAPCIAYALYHILAESPQASIAITPADHLVTGEPEFHKVMAAGFSFVEQHRDALLTIGIQPSRPETGYGYIEANRPTEPYEVVPVKNFKEKPDLPTAQRFLSEGGYYWNSGIFLWTAEAIHAAFRQHLPSLVALFDQGKNLFGTPQEQDFINRQFALCENISIDYGILEHSHHCYTLAADFGWSDIGTWGSLQAHSTLDPDGNALNGKALLVDSGGCVVNIEAGYQAIVQGLDHCLVALRDHSLLVCRLADEQRIKDWVAQLG